MANKTPSPDGAVGATTTRSAKVAESNAGKLRRVTIEPTKNGGYIVECDRYPAKSAGKSPFGYDVGPAEKFACKDRAHLDKVLDKELGVTPADESKAHRA